MRAKLPLRENEVLLVWSVSLNWDSAILMSGVMAWYGSVSSCTTATLLSAM